MNNDKSDDEHHDTAFIDSTVQEKNVTFPTDAKLHKKIIAKVLKIVKDENLPLRQSYTFVLKRIVTSVSATIPKTEGKHCGQTNVCAPLSDGCYVNWSGI